MKKFTRNGELACAPKGMLYIGIIEIREGVTCLYYLNALLRIKNAGNPSNAISVSITIPLGGLFWYTWINFVKRH